MELNNREVEALENRLAQLKDTSAEESRIQQATRRIAEVCVGRLYFFIVLSSLWKRSCDNLPSQ
jgi:hypothetical protein